MQPSLICFSSKLQKTTRVNRIYFSKKSGIIISMILNIFVLQARMIQSRNPWIVNLNIVQNNYRVSSNSSHKLFCAIWNYCSANQYLLFESSAHIFQQKQIERKLEAWNMKGCSSRRLNLKEEKRWSFWKRSLRCKASIFLCCMAAVKSSCTAEGINNSDGCWVSDRVGPEHKNGGKFTNRHTHTYSCLTHHYSFIHATPIPVSLARIP